MSHRHDSAAPRGVGEITSVHARAKGFMFATDAHNAEIFIHLQACRPRALFDELIVGDLVSYSVSEAPKGLRGHDVRRATPVEEARWREQKQAHTAAIKDRQGNSARHGERMSAVERLDEDDETNTPRFHPRRR